MTESYPLRIGTRGSPLALIQAEMVRDQLAAAHPGQATPVINVIRTTGDKVRNRALSEIGGKGLFTKEIEDALFSGAIDLAVHSMKDMPTWQPDGLSLVCQLEREDPRDALLARNADSVAGLRQNAVIGSASLRRRAQILMVRPDLEMPLIRGNVETRLAKLAAGEVDGTLLAMAGLVRLGMVEKSGAIALEPEEMLPAVAQGVICIECRDDDPPTRDALAPLNHQPTAMVTDAERAFLEVLDGSCRTPLAGYAVLDAGGDVHFRGLIARPDGSAHYRVERRGPPADAAAMGVDAGNVLKALAGPGFFDDD